MQKTQYALLLASLLSACAQAPVSATDAATSASALPAASAPTAVPPSPTTPAAAAVYGAPVEVKEPERWMMNQYKLAVAERIATSNSDAIKANAARPNDTGIRGLTVLGMQVRKDGAIDKVWVVRPSGDDNLDRVALNAVQNALPLPPPPENTMVGRGYTVFAESWLHRADGKFQLISKTTNTGEVATSDYNAAANKPAVKRVSAKPAAKTATKTTLQ